MDINKTEPINFEELLNKLVYKEEEFYTSSGTIMSGRIDEYGTKYYYYVDKAQNAREGSGLTYRIGTSIEREYYSPTIESEINERNRAVGKLQYLLVRKLFLEKVKNTSMFDKETIKELKEKESTLLASKGKLFGEDYLKYVSQDEMANLIDRTVEEKQVFVEKQEKEAAKRQEKAEKQAARKKRRKEISQKVKDGVLKVKDGALKLKVALITPVIDSATSAINAYKDKSNLGKDL